MNASSSSASDDAAERLRRWESFGATWQVLSRDEHGVVVSMCRCDGGEEVERLSSDDPALLEFLGSRRSSDD
ncbi:hypothetical protein [Leekyejoonella antrihumi]|uniref:Uncharacterized protein n=1 Tax=Leekyejoonella antrihumi TaxID=1660198 RepID=A0A563DTN1_9MICO|nr:hypothetical protein [Leekyejoonella antrihumi]TWP33618.1 hypothetical protein FGL98_20540 [Leekyejoonella antrihumi]